MKNVLITGGTSGIGFALARVFLLNQYNVVLVSSNQKNLKVTKENLFKEFNTNVIIVQQDLSEIGAAKRLYSSLQDKNISIDILVNNAGYGLVGPTEDIDFPEDENMMILNMITLVELCKLCLPYMYQNHYGKILNVSSTGAFQPGPYTATYFASKAFVLSYSQAIRFEAQKHGVQICTLCPGATKTNFFNREKTETPKTAMSSNAVAEYAYKQLIKNKAVFIPGFINRFMQLLPQKIKMLSVAKMKES